MAVRLFYRNGRVQPESLFKNVLEVGHSAQIGPHEPRWVRVEAHDLSSQLVFNSGMAHEEKEGPGQQAGCGVSARNYETNDLTLQGDTICRALGCRVQEDTSLTRAAG